MSRTWLKSCTMAALPLAATIWASCSETPTPLTQAPQPQAFATAGNIDLNHDNTPTTASPATEQVTSSLGDVGLWTFPSTYKVGTGLINPFLRIQQNNGEAGFNTNNGTPLDDKSGTVALALNHVPVIAKNTAYYRQIILDANESNDAAGDWRLSIDQFDVYVCKDGAQNYTLLTQVQDPNNCRLAYDLNNKIGFATDALTSGSGKTLDYDILIPEHGFEQAITGLGVQPGQCAYNGPTSTPCGLWVIVYTRMGFTGSVAGDNPSTATWYSDATFEEMSTITQPYVTVTKTATPQFTRTYNWAITKSVSPDAITLFDGQSQNAGYTVQVTQTGHTDSGWQVTGAVTINNPSDGSVNVTAVTDLLEPGDIPVTVDCGTLPFTLAAGATKQCTYTKTFASDPGSTTYTNTVTVTLEGLSVATGQSDPFTFTTPTTEVNKTVDVTDLFNANVTQLANDISAGQTFTYSHTFTCNADEGSHPNTAKVIGDNNTVLALATANVDVNCVTVQVTKDAATALQRTYKWTLAKSVTPSSWALFNGDQGTSDYTVTATPNGYDDNQLNVSGKIHIHNPETVNLYIGAIADQLSDATVATISNCMVGAASIATPTNAAMYTLAAGATIDCDYSATPAAETNGTNTATVTAKPTASGTAKNFTGTANYTWSSPTLQEVNKTIHVTDTYPYPGGSTTALGTSDWSSPHAPFTYSRTFACATDAGSHPNRATITETSQTADATVSVSCYTLAVTKDAATSFTRTWAWSIDKSIDESCFLSLPSGGDSYDSNTHTATIQQGEALTVCYNAALSGSSTDSNWKVTGNTTKITIHNNHPTKAATLTQVTDVLTGGINGTVDCGGVTSVPAGGNLVCDYTANLPNATARVNTATATQQNYSFASNLVATASGTTQYSGTANVTFSSTPTVETDECVDVTDALTQAGANLGSKNFGTWCASSGTSKTFSYTYTFGPNNIATQCGPNEFDNKAAFVTNDTQATGFSAVVMNINVNCQTGCTLTLGYWKTHNASFSGGASKKADPTWGLLDALAWNGSAWVGDGQFQKENEPFFKSGQTWFAVFWTKPQGNAYYNLADQYMAAVLNGLAGADQSAVATAISQATTLFETYTPAQIGALKNTPADKALRQQFINLAGTLGQYNEGLIGPGHCTENSATVL